MGEFLWAILSELLNIVVGKANSFDTRFIKLLRRLALFLGAIGILLLFASSFVEGLVSLAPLTSFHVRATGRSIR